MRVRCPECGAINDGPFMCEGAVTQRTEDEEGTTHYRAEADPLKRHASVFVQGDDHELGDDDLDVIEGRKAQEVDADPTTAAQTSAHESRITALEEENARLRAKRAGADPGVTGAGDEGAGGPPAPAEGSGTPPGETVPVGDGTQGDRAQS